MIKAETKSGGVSTVLYGDTMEILVEFISLTMSLRERLQAEYIDPVADELIAMCGKLAYADSDEEMESIMDGVTKILEDAVSDLKARG